MPLRVAVPKNKPRQNKKEHRESKRAFHPASAPGALLGRVPRNSLNAWSSTAIEGGHHARIGVTASRAEAGVIRINCPAAPGWTRHAFHGGDYTAAADGLRRQSGRIIRIAPPLLNVVETDL